jgi:hypothetical protein
MQGDIDWFDGDRHAHKLYADLCFVAHVWDDLIDKDKAVSEEQINSAFEAALVGIPRNPIYQSNAAMLQPLMACGCLGFRIATKMERSKDPHQIEIAHGLRYSIAQVGACLVMLTNTADKAAEILPEFWKHMMPERFGEYAKEHGYDPEIKV